MSWCGISTITISHCSVAVYVFKASPNRRGAKNLWASSSPYQESSKSEGGREGGRKKRGKTGWKLARKVQISNQLERD
jgi:hypothetical protein